MGPFPKRVDNEKRRRGDALTEEVDEQLLAYIRPNPGVPTRRVGRRLGIRGMTIK